MTWIMKSSNISKASSTVTFTICGSVNHDQHEIWLYSALDWPAREERMMPTISPYNANASAKMRMRIIPTKSFGCWAFALQKTVISKSNSIYSVSIKFWINWVEPKMPHDVSHETNQILVSNWLCLYPRIKWNHQLNNQIWLQLCTI